MQSREPSAFQVMHFLEIKTCLNFCYIHGTLLNSNTFFSYDFLKFGPQIKTFFSHFPLAEIYIQWFCFIGRYLYYVDFTVFTHCNETIVHLIREICDYQLEK